MREISKQIIVEKEIEKNPIKELADKIRKENKI
jgi:hypothetical protein